MGNNGATPTLSKEIHKACGSLTLIKVFIENMMKLDDAERTDFLQQYSKLCTDAIAHLEKTLHAVKNCQVETTPWQGRILVCDDNLDLANMLTIVFNRNGYISQAIQDMAELTSHLNTYPVGNCVFLDMWLGHIKGTDVAIALKKDYPKTRIILMSGDDISEVPGVDDLITSGVVAGFVRKPFSFENVKSLI